MPTRIVRQGINDSEAINSLSWRGENLYRRLMLEVDDFGRYECSPRLIRAKVFAHQLDRWNEDDVQKAINECSETIVSSTEKPYPLLTLYRVGGKAYLQINNFGQRIRVGQKSKYPSPPEVTARRGKNSRATESSRKTPDIPAYSESYSEPKAESNVNLSAADAAEVAALAFDLSDQERAEAYPAMAIPGLAKSALDTAAERIYDRHPTIRRCPLRIVTEKLEAIAKKAPVAQRLERVQQVDQNHAAWCETEQWQKENGEFAKGLENWLTLSKERWADAPPRAGPGRADTPGHMNPGLID